MKKTLLAMILAASVAGYADAEIYDFSYINKVDNSLGIKVAETYDVAIRLPGDLFEGYTIKGIKANVNASGGVACYSQPSVWLSSDIALKEGAFTPSIASYPSEISKVGLLQTQLQEGYVIPADGVYVGYSLTVTTLNNASYYPLCVGTGCTDSNAGFCRTSKSMPAWLNIALEGGYGVAITVDLEIDNLPAENVMLISLPSDIYMQSGKSWSGTVGLNSFASSPVNSVDIEYAIEGTPYSVHYDLPEAVPAGLNRKFEMPLEIAAIDHEMSEKITFKVTEVNGLPNQSAKAEQTSSLAVLNEYPAHQTLAEEYTGTWCGYCPRGFAAVEYIRENEPDFVVAVFHNNDPMQVTTNYPFTPSDYPYMSFNRQFGGDPYYGTGKYKGTLPVVEEIKAMNAELTPWGIEVSHSWDGNDTLVATADVWNVAGFEGGGYTIAFLLVADGLSGTSQNWIQTNNYAANAPLYIPQLNAFCRGGEYGKTRVVGLKYNDVVVSTNGIYGVKGSIPTTLAANEKATHSLSFDLTNINSRLIPDRNRLRVIAAVLDRNGVVLNCAKNEVNDYDSNAVDGVFDENAPVEYYNLNGVRVNEPAGGIYIRRQGCRTEKVVIR